MTNNTELKKLINKSFEEGKLSKAFEKLLMLPDSDISQLISKSKWLKQPNVLQYFWNDFAFNRHQNVFGGSAGPSFLNWYLTSSHESAAKLDELLVALYPQKFIQSIKRNRLFLDGTFLNRMESCDWSNKFYADVCAWKELYKEHARMQNDISKAWELVNHKDENTILCSLIYCIDEEYYLNDTNAAQEELRQVYNYTLTYIFSKLQKFFPSEEQQFDERFIRSASSPQVTEMKLFLDKITEWIRFESRVLSSYCFDDNFEAKLNNDVLHFDFISEEKYNYWLNDTKRYLVNAKRYFVDALQIYNLQDEAGELNIPAGRTEMDKNINHTLYIKNWQSTLFIQDLCIRNLIFKGRSVHVSRFLSGLMSYSINRKFRYEESMRNLIQKGANWMQAYIHNLKQSDRAGVTNTPMPYIFLKKIELIDIYKYALPELEESEIEDLISHFSYTLQPGLSFDPFNLRYSVLETPFLNLGDYVFTSTSFFASNDWFYSIAQRLLYIYANKSHTSERNETAAEMETGLGEEFVKHGWNVKVISSQEASKIDGDIDLFINDGKSQLLIQLKRTKFKLDLASDYKDTLETDLKARGQLNEAVDSLKSNPIVGMEILPNHEKWVVTTSFEGLLSEIDDCVKVNYFDLLWALRYKKFKSLNEFMTYIKSDGPFKDCRHYLDLEF